MPNYTQGSTRVVLEQPDLTTFQGNGSVVLDSRRARPLWFDGRFLDARDLDREQNYFLQREADLGQAGGFGVLEGLMVDQPAANSSQTLIVRAGTGVTPAGELVSISSDLTIPIAELLVDQSVNVQLGLATVPPQPPQSRSGLFVIAIRPVEFTANPITAYPTTINGPRTTHDGDIVEATAVTLVSYPGPSSTYSASLLQSALARQIFVTGNPATLPDSLLPLAVVNIQRGAISWIDPYLVRRDTGPQFNGVRFGLTDPATQQAYLLQYDTQLQAAVAARQASGLKANFAATDFFLSLPSAGRFPLDGIDTSAFSQVFFPQQMDVRLSIIADEELPALLEDSMSLPPIDLTLPQNAYSNLSVFAFVQVPLANFAALKASLPEIPLNPILPQVLANRTPLQLLQLYQGAVTVVPVPPVSNNAWANAVGSQTYGYYLRRRSDPTFVEFATPLTLVLTSSVNPSLEGQSVTFTVQATPASATGSVQFMDGPTALGNATLSGGAAAISTSALAVGAHSITAVYAGDAENAANTSNVLVQTVTNAPSSVTLAASANPATVGQAVTLNAQVAPASATGSMQFLDGATVLGTVTLSGGAAALSTSSLALGSHSITAVYSGDSNFQGSTSPVLTLTVVKAVSTVALTSSANPSTFGHAVTFTAQVTPSSATGTVQLLDGATTLGTGTLNGGAATFSTSSLAVGSHSITAAYGGNAAIAAGTSAPLTETVSAVTSSVTIASSANPSTVGQAVTFTSQVSPATATGTVKFSDGSTALGSATVSGGVATLPATSSLAVGTHSITAAYSGDVDDTAATSAVLVQTVSKLGTSVAVASSANPSTVGQAVTLTATITPNTATGSVQFLDGTAVLGTGTISGGVATLSGISSLAAGAHSITASYGGDANNGASTSGVLSQNVVKATTGVTVAAAPNPSTFGQTVTFTATITPNTATGSVQFPDGTVLLGTATVSGGSASLATATLAVASHSVTAVYSGDGSNSASTSPAVVQTVNKAASTVALSLSANPSAFGQAITLTARVTPASATGTVAFLDGTANIGSAAMSGGAAVLTISSLAVGSHSITAVYGGDGNDAGSTSAPLAQTVAKATTTTAVSSSVASALVGASIVFTARVTPATATGAVTFLDSGKSIGTGTLNGGVTTLTTSTLAAGSHTITAQYAGDANNNTSTSTAVVVTITNPTVGSTPILTIPPVTLTLPGVTIPIVNTISPNPITGGGIVE